MTICAVEGCTTTSRNSHTMCSAHENRKQRYGDPLAGGPLRPRGATPEQRFWAKVEKTESCWLWTAATISSGYGSFRLSGKGVLAHRFSIGLALGPVPEGVEVDHKCHTPLCVRPDHLRLAGRKENSENQGGLRSNNRSGARGVCWNKNARKWHAQVRHNGKTIHIGYFISLDEAAEAARALRLKLFTFNDADRADFEDVA